MRERLCQLVHRWGTQLAMLAGKNVVARDVEQVGCRIVDGYKAPDAVDGNSPPGCCGPYEGDARRQA
jgi:hypothetical protein